MTFIALGGFFVYQSLNLKLGTDFRMVPGFFLLFLARFFTLLGVVVLVQAKRVKGEPMGRLALRGVLFIRDR